MKKYSLETIIEFISDQSSHNDCINYCDEKTLDKYQRKLNKELKEKNKIDKLLSLKQENINQLKKEKKVSCFEEVIDLKSLVYKNSNFSFVDCLDFYIKNSYKFNNIILHFKGILFKLNNKEYQNREYYKNLSYDLKNLESLDLITIL